ncbi:MAG: hypothetical protein PHU79_00900 [Oscillospiraceae bacterium]|nr:hypothetical protein [Oscillospiraceae bacterium]
MSWKRLMSQSYRYLITVVAFLLLLVPNVGLIRQMNGSLELYFLACYGGICDVTDMLGFLNMRWIILNAVSVYMLSNLFMEDCRISYVYVFTRSQKKSRWLFRQMLHLLGRTCSTFGLLFIVTLLLGVFNGLKPQNSMHMAILLLVLYVLNTGTVFFFAFLQNAFSLKLGSAAAFIITLLFYFVPVFIGCALYKDASSLVPLYILLPGANQMLLWHTLPFTISGQETFGIVPVPNASAGGCICAIILWCIICYWLYRQWFYKQDMISLMKEEQG